MGGVAPGRLEGREVARPAIATEVPFRVGRLGQCGPQTADAARVVYDHDPGGGALGLHVTSDTADGGRGRSRACERGRCLHLPLATRRGSQREALAQRRAGELRPGVAEQAAPISLQVPDHALEALEPGALARALQELRVVRQQRQVDEDPHALHELGRADAEQHAESGLRGPRAQPQQERPVALDGGQHADRNDRDRYDRGGGEAAAQERGQGERGARPEQRRPVHEALGEGVVQGCARNPGRRHRKRRRDREHRDSEREELAPARPLGAAQQPRGVARGGEQRERSQHSARRGELLPAHEPQAEQRPARGRAEKHRRVPERVEGPQQHTGRAGGGEGAGGAESAAVEGQRRREAEHEQGDDPRRQPRRHGHGDQRRPGADAMGEAEGRAERGEPCAREESGAPRRERSRARVADQARQREEQPQDHHQVPLALAPQEVVAGSAPEDREAGEAEGRPRQRGLEPALRAVRPVEEGDGRESGGQGGDHQGGLPAGEDAVVEGEERKGEGGPVTVLVRDQELEQRQRVEVVEDAPVVHDRNAHALAEGVPARPRAEERHADDVRRRERIDRGAPLPCRHGSRVLRRSDRASRSRPFSGSRARRWSATSRASRREPSSV
jgi:hypothetical protein